jgi:hypothetical protein
MNRKRTKDERAILIQNTEEILRKNPKISYAELYEKLGCKDPSIIVEAKRKLGMKVIVRGGARQPNVRNKILRRASKMGIISLLENGRAKTPYEDDLRVLQTWKKSHPKEHLPARGTSAHLARLRLKRLLKTNP